MERLTVPVNSFILITAIKVPGLTAVFKELENTFLNLAVNNTVNTSQLNCQEIQKTMKQAQQLFLNGKQLKLLQSRYPNNLLNYNKILYSIYFCVFSSQASDQMSTYSFG